MPIVVIMQNIHTRKITEDKVNAMKIRRFVWIFILGKNGGLMLSSLGGKLII